MQKIVVEMQYEEKRVQHANDDLKLSGNLRVLCVCKDGPLGAPSHFLNSQELCNAHEVRLFQIFEAGEGLVEILRQVEHFLGHFDDCIFLRLGCLDELLHDGVRDERLALQLLADFEGNVKSTDANKGWFAAGQLVVVHRHLAQIHRHLEYQVVKAGRCITRLRQILLLLSRQASLADMTNLENLLKVVS